MTICDLFSFVTPCVYPNNSSVVSLVIYVARKKYYGSHFAYQTSGGASFFKDLKVFSCFVWSLQKKGIFFIIILEAAFAYAASRHGLKLYLRFILFTFSRNKMKRNIVFVTRLATPRILLIEM